MSFVGKCKAAILEESGKPLVVRELSIPELSSGQVLVKVMFSGVCRSQLMEVSGGRGLDEWLPHLLGHEGSGVVIGVGPNVTKVRIGDEVILGWLKGDGLDAPGAKYTFGDQVINSGKVTTFSNYTVVSESRVYKKPESMALDVAVLFGCALTTGAGMVFNQAIPNTDSIVAVLGLGGVGYSALMAAKAIGVKKLIAVDISDEKLNLAKKLGATKTYNSKDPNFVKEIYGECDGGVDICIESAGLVETIELGFSLIRYSGGRLYFASHPAEGQQIRLMPHDLIRGKQIFGSWGGGSTPDKDVQNFANRFEKSNINYDVFLSKRYTLDSINDALNDLRDGKVFRPLIVMSHD